MRRTDHTGTSSLMARSVAHAGAGRLQGLVATDKTADIPGRTAQVPQAMTMRSPPVAPTRRGSHKLRSG